MNINFDDLNLMFKMLIPDSLSKKEKGDFFEAVTARLFTQRGLKVTPNVRLPGVQIDIALLKIFKLLNSNLTKPEAAKNLNLKYKDGKRSTIENAIQDLQKFLPLETQQNSGLVKIPSNINRLNEIAEIFADYLESHVLIQEIYREYQPDQCFHYDDFDKILLKNCYVSSSRDPKDYRSRFLSWFCFAGLLEIRQDEWIYRPINSTKGKHKGNVLDCEFRNKRRKDKSKGKYRQLNALDLL
jgi:hypothetical protein